MTAPWEAPPYADLGGDVALRLVDGSDAAAVSRARRGSADHLTPWEPVRPPGFDEVDAWRTRIGALLTRWGRRECLPLHLVDTADADAHVGPRVVGAVTVNDIVWGPFRSAHLGYWLTDAATGRGVMTRAVEATCGLAHAAGLHRLQAATLVDNDASRAVLTRTGFEQIGRAPRYLAIAGRWQDHLLWQRILHDEPPVPA